MMRFSSIRWKRACLHRELPNHLHLTPSIFTSTNRDTWFNYQHFIHRTQKTLSMGSDVKSWSRAKLCEVKKLSLRLRQLGLTCTPHYSVMYCTYVHCLHTDDLEPTQFWALVIWKRPNQRWGLYCNSKLNQVSSPAALGELVSESDELDAGAGTLSSIIKHPSLTTPSWRWTRMNTVRGAD